VTQPSGGEEICLFWQQMIRWQTSGDMGDRVRISLMYPGGVAVRQTIHPSAPNTGQFLWSGGGYSGEYFIRVRVSPTPEYPDIVTGESGLITMTDCDRPDLKVGVITVSPQNPGQRQTVTFKANIMNYGNVPVEKPVVGLRVNRPGGLPPKTFQKEMDVTLPRNQGITFVQQFSVPEPGNYTCLVTLDPAGAVPELDDSNNTASWVFGVHPLPDLVVCIDNGKRPPVGRKREIRAVVINQGTSDTGPPRKVRLRFHVEGKGTKIYDIPPLEQGNSYAVKRRHRWGRAGTKTVSAQVLYSGNELDTGNNSVRGSFFVRLPHHDKYSTAPKIKCSSNRTFNSWKDFSSGY